MEIGKTTSRLLKDVTVTVETDAPLHAFRNERVRPSVSEYRHDGNENYKGHLRRLSRFLMDAQLQ